MPTVSEGVVSKETARQRKGISVRAFDAFKDRRLRSCLIWAHARNNACFFYEAMGGRRVAQRGPLSLTEQIDLD